MAEARAQAHAHAHPYTGRESTDAYFEAELMPSLTGQPEYQAHSPDSYRLLAGLISQRVTASLGPTLPPPDTLTASFNVGPYGGIFQAVIEHEQLEDSHSPEAVRAVIQAVRS
jgi:hypothetical protein